MIKAQRLLNLVFAIAVLFFLGAPLLAHGGRYSGPGGGAGVPAPRPGATPRGGGTRADARPTWQNWWDRNREEFFNLRQRRAEKSGNQQDGYARGKLHQPATRKDIDDTILPALLNALSHKNADIRDAACIAVGRAGHVPITEDLAKMLSDSNRKVRQAAIMGLGLIGHEMAQDKLVQVLLNPDTAAKERGMAAISLGLGGGKRANKALHERIGLARPFTKVSSSKAQQVDGCRAVGIGLLNEKASVPALVTAIKKGRSKDRFFPPMALVGLAKIADDSVADLALKCLDDRKNDVRRSAAILVGRCIKADDKKRIKKVISLWKGERDAHARYFTTISLGRIGGPQVHKALRKALKTERNREDKSFAALGLAISKDPEGNKILTDVLTKNKDQTLRSATAIALAILGDPAAKKPLLDELTKTKNPAYRAELITALAMFDHVAALPEIRKIMAIARNERLSRACGLALALMQDGSSIETMVEIMRNSGSIQVKGGMATALGRTGDRRAIAPLLKIINKSSETDMTQAFAIVALGLIADKSPASAFSRVSIDSNYAMSGAEALLEVIDIF